MRGAKVISPSPLVHRKAVALTRLVVTAAALAAVSAGSAAAVGFPPFPGTYQVTVTGRTPALDGTWRIVMTKTGRYDILKGGRKLVSGTAKAVGAASRQQVVFTDRSGPAACRGSQASGLYHWSFGMVYLDLKALRDACAARRVVLTARPLKLVESG